MVRRLGNKSRIADKIYPLFPPHQIYVELFFGAGGMFFNKPRAKYNFLNDIDSELMNCYDVLMRRPDELRQWVEMTPYSADLFKFAKTAEPVNEVERAVFFLVLSNWGYMGKPDTLCLITSNSKNVLITEIENTYRSIVKTENRFLNCGFDAVLDKVSFKDKQGSGQTLIYSDPPYLGTENNYNAPIWTESDAEKCFDVTFNTVKHGTRINGAMSEFDHPFILEQAEKRGLNIHIIGERRNMKNRRTEIPITNYKQVNKLF